jgi:hypothetical protein
LSAKPGINISEMLMTFVDNSIYKADYETVTSRLLDEQISYETAIESIKKIARTGFFEENERRY